MNQLNHQEKQALYRLWKEEEAATFTGWDFSHLNGRCQDGELPWNYESMARSLLCPEKELLDMGTGGGEFLLTLGHPGEHTTVTEGYPPNVQLCRQRLEPLGIRVVEASGEELLPLESERFDVILNRHEDFRAEEIFRLLKPGGVFLTQQVGGQNDNDLSRVLIPGFVPQYPHHTLANNRRLLEEAGLVIREAKEHFSPIRFFDVGALVYFAKILPWEFPGFTVDGCLETLFRLEEQRRRDGFVEGTEHRFLLLAEKR